MKTSGKAKVKDMSHNSKKPTDALLLRKWSSRNPVQIPNYPGLDEDETEHAYLLSEVAVQQ